MAIRIVGNCNYRLFQDLGPILKGLMAASPQGLPLTRTALKKPLTHEGTLPYFSMGMF